MNDFFNTMDQASNQPPCTSGNAHLSFASTKGNIFDQSKLYNYINYIDTYRHDMYNHFIIIIVLGLLYSTLGNGINVLYQWICCISAIIGFIYSILSGVYLFKVIGAWDSSIKSGILKFWNLCTQLAIKNYRLMREYREVYQHHYNDIIARCFDKDAETKKYVEYVMKNDATEKMENYDWIRITIEHVNQYIKLCYYLAFVQSNDCLELRQDNIYVNIKTESVLNKRNRKLEILMNEIPIEYKHELVTSWNNIDKTQSDKMLILIPCKWIMYEYRNMFRYLHCAKYFKNIYGSFDKDYTEIESIVYEMCSVLQDVFRRDTIYVPHAFLSLFCMLSDTLLIVLDNFIAINIISCFVSTGSLFVPVIISCVMHSILYCIIISISKSIDEIKKPLIHCTDLENIDKKIETIFNEMKVLLFDGKIKRVL